VVKTTADRQQERLEKTIDPTVKRFDFIGPDFEIPVAGLDEEFPRLLGHDFSRSSP
jgi:hypothetical protein